MVRAPGAQDKARKSEREDDGNLPPIPAFVFFRQTGYPAAGNRQRDTGEPEWGGDPTEGNRVVTSCGVRGSGEQQPKDDHPPSVGRDREPTSEAVNRHAHQPFLG